jgi:hypothetical protein
VIALASGTTQAAGNLGTLTLTGASSIEFPATGSATIKFSTSSYSSWTAGSTLYIDNWSSSDALYFGASASGLGSGGPVFTNIVFVNPSGDPAGNYAGEISNKGLITPDLTVRVPEIGSLVYGGLLAGLVVWRHRRRLKLPDIFANR